MASIVINQDIRIPAEATDLDGFRLWARTDSFPNRGRFDYLGGDLWIDLTPEELYSHNGVRTSVTVTLANLADECDLGHYFSAGMRLTNLSAQMSVMPDAIFVSFDARRDGRLQYVPTGDGDYDELLGAPDMVMEVIGYKTETRDDSILRDFYWRANVPEYWLADMRGAELRFDILRRSGRGYVAARRQPGGWLKSQVFDRSFRFLRTIDPIGSPRYELEVRP